MSVLVGTFAASAAALLLNTSYLVQHSALSSAPVIRVSRPLLTLRALLASRRWVIGALLGYGGLALNTLALGLAPLSLVQSIVAAGLVVVALGAARVRRLRPGARELVAIGLVVVALGALGVGAGAKPPGAPSAAALLAFEAIAGLVAWAVARRGDGAGARPHRLGLAAGILYGATNVALAALLASGGAAALLTVGLGAGAAVTAGGFFAFQRGLQSGPAIGVVTLMTAGTNVVAILGGLLVMGEPLGATPALAMLHAGAFALVVLAGLLAASEISRLAAPAAAPGTPTPAALPRTCSVAPRPAA
jgi:hypothetical protein